MSHRVRVSSAVARTGAVTAVALAAVLLVGCTSNPVQPAPASTNSPAATEAPVAGGEGETPTPEPSVPAGIPVDLACDQIVTPDEIFEFNPNYSPDPAYSVQSGSVAADIVDLQGVSCSWINQTSNETIEVAIAHLDPADIEAQKNDLITSSNFVPTYNGVTDEGYFTTVNGVGRADVFVGDFWVVANSTAFFEPGDAEQIVRYAAASVG